MHRHLGNKREGRGLRHYKYPERIHEFVWDLVFSLALVLFLILRMVLRAAWFKGRLGESKVNVGTGLLLDRGVYRLIKNVTLSAGDGTTQIDQLVVSPYGIFVIETKNMKGWIFGDPYQAQWTQQIYRYREKFPNPLRQNYKHVKAVQELLGLGPHQVFNVVLLVGDCALKTQMPPEVLQGVFALSKFIKSKRVPVLAGHELPGLIDRILDQRLYPGLRTNLSHIHNVKRQASRSEVDTNICPSCGAGMVERTNRRSGERFLGCRRYPQCRGTRSLP